jgi:hypothetical protein
VAVVNPWLQLLGSGGLAAVIVVAENAIANRRNLGAQTSRTDAETSRTDAETDELIRKTYGGMLADMQGQLNAAVLKASDLTVRVAELEDEREEGRRVLQLHAAWDHMAITKLRECDPPMTLPDPPPLTPPSRRRRPPKH